MVQRPDDPLLSMTLWPHQSLTPKGLEFMSWMIGIGLAIPAFAFVGTAAFWGMLPFVIGAFLLFRFMIHRNQRARRLHEELSIWPDLITVRRYDPDGTIHNWQANPYWVSVTLHDNAKIGNYLTLKGAGREIELGAFLTPEERVTLAHDLRRALARAK
ncbi:Uncharacterized membrane protein [Monaibacterium marinum]|uniref:Uncharacterized membrane protein n=1 Tax=Pontivivens marinum TaxID=1690039 RepID=A0A2C9CQB7_9RHOB|nr:DUF2244 domain-containing protein [Monaibacterium marinum]SOH93524.1 Uncharacterized membrane protein [Monaibacterium marinum]